MKEALEALENTYAYLPRRWGGEREADQAITALRQAIAEAEKQPVHASDISQERADETAKCVHEFECPRCGHCCQQREWVEQPDLARVGEVGVWGKEKNT
jgi:protein tyrosine phosphatase (PTP) superfamily phosphohydrolase (DUF442 family)